LCTDFSVISNLKVAINMFFGKILKNKYLLNVTIIFTYLCLFVGCVGINSYSRYILFFGIASAVLSIIVIFFYVFFDKKMLRKSFEFTFRINKYLFVLLLASYIVFQIIESNTYSGYVLLKYNLTFFNLVFPLAFCLCLIIIKRFLSLNTPTRKNSFAYVIDLGAFMVLAVGLFTFCLFYGSRLLGQMIYDSGFIIANYNLSKDKKNEKELGRIFYDLTILVSEKTDKNSRILVPPQTRPYISTGDCLFFGYFIYPRSCGNGSPTNISTEGYDYVLVVRGEGEKAEPEKYFWPRERIEAERVYYIDYDGGFKEYKGDYYPESFPGVGGLIKLPTKL